MMELLSPVDSAILLRVAPNTAITQAGKLLLPPNDLTRFLREIPLANMVNKEGVTLFIEQQRERINAMYTRCPGATGITVASSYGLSLLLSDLTNQNPNNEEDIVKLSHGCLLVKIETRDDPLAFNIAEFVQRLQHVTGDSSLCLIEPPKYLCDQSEGCFVPAPLQDAPYKCVLQALEQGDLTFFSNRNNVDTVRSAIEHSVGWVIWPRLFLYMVVDVLRRHQWGSILEDMLPILAYEEKVLLRLLLDNFKEVFGEYRSSPTPAGRTKLSSSEMMIIQPLAKMIVPEQLALSPMHTLCVGEVLFKSAIAAADKGTYSIPKSVPTLSAPLSGLAFEIVLSESQRSGWKVHTIHDSGSIATAPSTRLCFQVSNTSAFAVCWQVWSFSTDRNEKPSMLLPHANTTPVAIVTPRNTTWPMGKTLSASVSKNVLFQLGDEGTETIVFFAWWDDGTGIRYQKFTNAITIV